ncbi:MAG TPA: 3-isopropylmalate dehydrogenase, partial [Hyphomicrobiaceae bacterium]|nr:3-isopropylmalate dehydrogenase [Hyphomicrobiaceae bacterium]
MRAHRIALEFERAELGMQDLGIKSTVVVFGSSRVSEGKAAKASGKQADSGRRGLPSNASLASCYQMAREFGRIVSERGGALSSSEGMRENVITTGGGPGI